MSDVDPSLEGPPWEEDLPERDENTDDMFGAPAAAPAPPVEAVAKKPKPIPVSEPAPVEGEAEAYTVLARKYRPRTFEDLIGQEAMVRTLTNAFATGRIAHAFMLTGVRGVGKTTTARLLARALNNETDVIDKPSLTLTAHGRHDAAIMAGQHMDVMEMDAASNTSINDIREIIEGSLRLIGQLPASETLDAADAADALAVLNMMLESWSTERLSVFTTQDQVFTWPASQRIRTLEIGRASCRERVSSPV